MKICAIGGGTSVFAILDSFFESKRKENPSNQYSLSDIDECVDAMLNKTDEQMKRIDGGKIQSEIVLSKLALLKVVMKTVLNLKTNDNNAEKSNEFENFTYFKTMGSTLGILLENVEDDQE